MTLFLGFLAGFLAFAAVLVILCWKVWKWAMGL